MEHPSLNEISVFPWCARLFQVMYLYSLVPRPFFQTKKLTRHCLEKLLHLRNENKCQQNIMFREIDFC